MTLRAEASERLSDEIIANLTAGLLMVNRAGEVQIVNPVGRRLLNLGEGPHRGANYRQVLAHAEPLAALIEQCLSTGRPMIRRAVEIPTGQAAPLHLGLSVSPLGGRLVGAARRDLPLHRSVRGRRARGAGAAEGQPGARRRADGRHRARVPERAGDDSRLQPAAESRGPARGVPALRRRHSRRNRVDARGRDQLPELREAGAADLVAGRSRRSRGARRRRSARRRARAVGRHPRRRRVRHRRRRRCAAAAGVQQPAAKRDRSVRGGRHRAGHCGGGAASIARRASAPCP